MAGLFTYSLAGGGFVLIGASEAILSSSEALQEITHKLSQPSSTTLPSSTNTSKRRSFSSSLMFFSISLLSVLFILNSLISLTDALNTKDQTGVVIQLEVIAIASLFFLFSVLGILTSLRNSFQFPSSILCILCFFGFVEEFFLFYLQNKDPDGIENRYYDLLLVPITICIFSTLLELSTPKFSKYSRLGCGVGLVLQGMWFIQMGFSFYSKLITEGCSIHGKSRGNFTIKCKGKPASHRAMAIATLQFNCHLALLVCFIVGLYSLVCKKHGVSNESMQYQPLGAEMQQLDNQAQFTLDTDDEDEDDNNGGVKEEENVAREKSLAILPESRVNGYDSHQ